MIRTYNCHAERSEESARGRTRILRCAQHDSKGARWYFVNVSRETFLLLKDTLQWLRLFPTKASLLLICSRPCAMRDLVSRHGRVFSRGRGICHALQPVPILA